MRPQKRTARRAPPVHPPGARPGIQQVLLGLLGELAIIVRRGREQVAIKAELNAGDRVALTKPAEDGRSAAK